MHSRDITVLIVSLSFNIVYYSSLFHIDLPTPVENSYYIFLHIFFVNNKVNSHIAHQKEVTPQ